MAFQYDIVEPKSFNSLGDLKAFIKKTDSNIEKLPIDKLLKDQATFFDDARFGSEDRNFGFTEYSFKAICQHFAVPGGLIEGITKEGLASALLNDFINNNKGRQDVSNTHLIVDNAQQKILGIVTGSYVYYSNHEFIEMVEEFLGGWDAKENNTQLESAHYCNTRLYVRLITNIEAGVITGKGGKKKDVTKIGLHLTNSMVGDLPVRIAYFLFRLLCANGLVAKITESVAMVKHSGYRESFDIRFSERVTALLQEAKQVTKFLNTLAKLPFDPSSLVKAGFSGAILDILPEMRSTLRREVVLDGESDIVDLKKRKVWRETKYIEAIPHVYGREHSLRVFNSNWRDNASMFDFINILTEYAKELPLLSKIEAEERVGEFAEYILKNQKKLARA